MVFPGALAVEQPARSVVVQEGWEASLRELAGWEVRQVRALLRSMGDDQDLGAWEDSHLVDPNRRGGIPPGPAELGGAE